MWKRLRAIFISGLLALLPLGLTYFILQFLYKLVEGSFGSGGFLGSLVRNFLGQAPPETLINLLSILITLAVILAVGALTRFYLGRAAYLYFERILMAIPVLRKLYGTVKQITDAVFNRDMSAFKRVALVEYPRKGLYMIGFVTNQDVPGIEEVVGEKLVSIFIMAPPNPITGIWLIVPEKDVTYLDHITVEEGFRMMMSLGIFMPPEVRERLLQAQTISQGVPLRKV
ncbi:MAG: hypothetical protein A2Z21_09035 [Candidatus Fraserbacteria bacterium RBG_16_55_9]|uniref:DUF502 domain-containing protein n=1 Tax=Fraserbacteria sp. (strain RBG_16_55_9) TaxID=1817864 RepID=A0A1F5UUG0_FRAXR|nr:MAG: hypothetical protein A2Z21_09035 [Candidatus Fraserbacteria bacterium RBG_16_55_9]